MSQLDIVIEAPVSRSVRVAQVSSMFDVPPQEKARMEWHGNVPVEDRIWNVGLIVGPSGCGKSTILRRMFGDPPAMAWGAPSVIDDFSATNSVADIAGVCQAVGFNTIPAWLRPKDTLSNGEQFRVELARRLLEGGELVAMDEFTSVVDRRVAQIGSHAVQKWVRKHNRRFVAASCHFDLEDWLQPDWVLEPATMTFRWRSVQRRPEIACRVARVTRDAWKLFSRFHYLTATLHPSAQCHLLTVEGEAAAFVATMFRPQSTPNVWGGSRIVTLPDYQGMGLAFALLDRVAAAHAAIGHIYRAPPAHPSFCRAFARSRNWKLIRSPGYLVARNKHAGYGAMGGRPNATFQYVGPKMEIETAQKLLGV